MSVNLPNLAPKTREEGNAAKRNGKASTMYSLPAASGPTKYHARKSFEDKLGPYRSGDYRQKLPTINVNPKTYELSTTPNIKNLKRQNGDLQLQLVVFKTQSKMMRNVLHRHSVALQEYQRLEGNISKIQEQHINEVNVIRKLLWKTRSSCDTLTKKLQDAENELFDSKKKILQLESQIFHNPTMLEKEELSRRLDEATIDLKEKNKRIWELEKNNKLLQSTLHRHIAAEQKKLSKTTDVFYCLQARVYELTREIQDRKNELEHHNLPGLRFEHLASKKETLNKIVQTEEVASPLTADESLVKADVPKPDDELQKWLRSPSGDNAPGMSLAVKCLKKRRRLKEDLKEIPDHQMAGDCSERKDVTDASRVAIEEEEEEEDDEEDWIGTQNSLGSSIFADAMDQLSPRQIPKRTHFCLKYVFTPATTNLHLGKPAYSGLDQKSLESRTHGKAPTKKAGHNAEEDDY
ncbi:lebercilin-like protein isoform X2 [Syngnathus scovelli]|uniref:lebercilin-like protein isoform X2 n=1 Tax=Syngnathus scovelli TaxID=161590 RepID=UPI0021102A34|nr:uncharacterized protein LOC125971947 isoform X2 [Syngnathus scovelli]